jgi:hypothetical protein
MIKLEENSKIKRESADSNEESKNFISNEISHNSKKITKPRNDIAKQNKGNTNKTSLKRQRKNGFEEEDSDVDQTIIVNDNGQKTPIDMWTR